MQELHEAGCLLDGILAVTHPEMYEAGRRVMRALYTKDAQQREMADMWPSVYHAVQVIANRETLFHRDVNALPPWYDLLLSVGNYGKTAVFSMRTLGVCTPYDSGSVVMICSRIIVHGVGAVPPDRICYAWLMRDAVLDYFGVASPGWSKLSDRILG